MQLRPYQQECLETITADLALPGASIAVMPTGSGKSHVIAAAALLKSPVLILQPSVELLRQNKEKLEAIIGPDDIGVYSASFGQKDIRTFTFATIQSVYKKPELFKDIQLVILDECHQLSPRNTIGMLTSFTSKLQAKIIGLTATPYRTETVYEKVGNDLYAATGIKMINRMHGKGTEKPFWKGILYTISHAELIRQGYLCPIEYVHEPIVPYEAIPINVSHSDFNLEKYSQMIIGFEAQMLSTIAEAQRRFKSVLVFCTDVSQAERLSEIVKDSAVVVGSSLKKDRMRIIDDFKSGKIKTVFNVGCLTTGFDHPALDCVILLRPVKSPILYQQMIGRLTRVAEGKTHGTVIDLTGSCKALGAIETFEVFKTGWAWDVKSEKVDGFHGKLLFRMKIES